MQGKMLISFGGKNHNFVVWLEYMQALFGPMARAAELKDWGYNE